MQRFGFKCRKIVTWNSDGVIRRLLAPLRCSEEFSLRLHFSKPLNLNLFSIIHFELNTNARIQKKITGEMVPKDFFICRERSDAYFGPLPLYNSAHGTVCCTSMIMYFVRSILNFLSWILVFQKLSIWSYSLRFYGHCNRYLFHFLANFCRLSANQRRHALIIYILIDRYGV